MIKTFSKTKFLNLKYSIKSSKIYRIKFFNYTKQKLKEEKYSYQYVEKIITELINKTHRDISNLPNEFHKFRDVILTLEKAVEPDDYECCG